MNRDNTPTFNVNRKVVNFKDFSSDPQGEKEDLIKVQRSTNPNTPDQQQYPGNKRFKFNKTTYKMDDMSDDEVVDKINAIEESISIENIEKIVISYWHDKLPDLEWEHHSLYDYSPEFIDEIINKCMSKGYSIMLRPGNTALIVYIDNGRFRQR